MRVSTLFKVVLFAIGALIVVLLTRSWVDDRAEQSRLRETLQSQKVLIDGADARERQRDAGLKEALAKIAAEKRAAHTPAEMAEAIGRYASLPGAIDAMPAGTSPGPVGKTSRGAGSEGSDGAGDRVLALAPPQFGSSPSTVNHQSVLAAESEDAATNGRNALPSGANAASANRSGVGTAAVPAFERERSEAGESALNGLPSHLTPLNSLRSPSARLPAADLKPLYEYVQDCRSCQLQLETAKRDSVDSTAKIVGLTRERDAAVAAAKGGSVWRRVRRNALWLSLGVCGGVVGAELMARARPHTLE